MPTEGAGSTGRGGDTGLICITARRVRRGRWRRFLEWVLVWNLRRQRREGGSGGGGRWGRSGCGTPGHRYRTSRPGREWPGSGSALRNAAPRGGGGCSAHAPGLQLCTRAAARASSGSGAQRSYAGAAWEHVTRLQCRRRRACALLFSRRGGSRWGAGCGEALSSAPDVWRDPCGGRCGSQVGLAWGRAQLELSAAS